MPSDCFSSTMKKDRHVVPGIKPEETDPCSNTRERRKRSMYVFIHVLGEGMAPTGVKFLGVNEFPSFDGMSLKFISKPYLEIHYLGRIPFPSHDF